MKKVVVMRKERWRGPDRFLSPSLKIIGGKMGQTIASPRSKVYSIIPPDTTDYLEPFLGGSSVLVGKSPHSKEYVNDINPWVINYYHCLQEDWRHLFNLLSKYCAGFNARKFQVIRDMLTALPDTRKGRFKDAAAFYAVNKHANNGIFRFNNSGHCNSSYCKTAEGRGIFDEDWISRVAERVKDVEFFNLDYQDFFKACTIHQKKAIVFLDPPYFNVETKYYKEWHKEDHRRLRDFLKESRFRWILTYNDHKVIRRAYREFNIMDNETLWCCSNTSAGRGLKKELIITNYDVKL